MFGLHYLFLGKTEPPAPGPRIPGFDGTPTDPFTCGDMPPTGLPGVFFDLSGNPQTFTLAEAADGVRFRYEVVIENDLQGVFSRPLDAGGCDQPHASGLRLLERISGDGQLYCLCDTGLCLPVVDSTNLRAGRYGGSFEWTGRSWQGPSDTGNPMGAAFPPGRYVFEIRAQGVYPGEDGCAACDVAFENRAVVEFELVPLLFGVPSVFVRGSPQRDQRAGDPPEFSRYVFARLRHNMDCVARGATSGSPPF